MIASNQNRTLDQRMIMQSVLKYSCLAFVLSLSSISALAAQENVEHGVLSGSIGAVTKYVYRGGVENDDIAFQGGLQYAHKSVVFVGYWGSTLDYDSTDEHKDHGFEHDFAIGYANEINEDLSYSTQVTAFVYQNGGRSYNADRTESRRSTGTEWFTALDFKDLSLGLGVALSDANYGNAGDVYLSAGYGYPLIYDISLNTSVGASIYNDNRDDDLIQTSKTFVVNETRLGLSTPLADSSVDIALDYIWGGKNRLNEKLDDHLVFAVNYSF